MQEKPHDKDTGLLKTIDNRVFHIIPSFLKGRGFTDRKLTDTPTDDLQVVPKKYVDSGGRRGVQCIVFNFTRAVIVGDGRFYIHIDQRLEKLSLIDVHAEVITAGTTGTTDIQIHNIDKAVDMLSTKLTIDSGEKVSDTAVTPAVINSANAAVDLNDTLRIDTDAVSTTPPLGLIVTLGFG